MAKIKVGEKITFDANARGVNPKITTGEIVSINNAIQTRNSGRAKEYKVKLENGNTITIGDLEIESAKDFISQLQEE